MDVSWAFVVLLVYPALQLPMMWVVVRYFGLRNDDGPRDPRGYSLQPGENERFEPGDCRVCGASNDPAVERCWSCQARLV
jgi:ribosomal protein L40E